MVGRDEIGRESITDKFQWWALGFSILLYVLWIDYCSQKFKIWGNNEWTIISSVTTGSQLRMSKVNIKSWYKYKHSVLSRQRQTTRRTETRNTQNENRDAEGYGTGPLLCIIHFLFSLTCYGLNCIPLLPPPHQIKRFVRVLTPETSASDLIWK